MSREIDDGLTEEERAALSDDDGGDGAANNDAGDGAGDENGESAESSESQAEVSGAAAEAAASAAAADAAGVSETNAQPTPVLVAPVPADIDAKLAEIGTQKSSLLDQFDNGDITAKEYQIQLDALAKQERTIERQQDRADLAGQMEQQRLQNEWTATCNRFVESNAIYKDNPRLYKALDAEVRELAQKPDTANWSGQKFLDEAHKNLKAAFGLTDAAKAPAAKAAPQQRELPPNLAKVPAADLEDTNGGRFAVLDRMANSDPLAYEETLNKMSAAERDAYLSA